MKTEKFKKISEDIIINLIGTGIGLFVLQLIIYPLIALNLDSNSYGQMQAIISMIYMISGTLGGTLSTTRLVREYDYNEKKLKGDYNLISLICLMIIIISIPLILVVYGNEYQLVDKVLIVLIGIFNFTGNYLSVGFRLKINYKAIFVSKLIGTGGYLIGFGLFYVTDKWQFVFIISFALETLFCIIKTDLFKEPFRWTKLICETNKTFINLGVANLLSRTLTYVDKLLLYPLLGGTAVSIYYTANIFGKLIIMTVEPITNVILSYLSKEKTISKKIWKVTIPLAGVSCLIMYIFCLFISSPIIRFFYPQWADPAIKLVPLTTLCLAVSAFINIIYPFTLKLIESNKQIIINGTGIIVYIISALLLYKSYSITGCCLALLMSYLAKLLLIFIFCFRRYEYA